MDLAHASAPASQARSFGEHLRHWRPRRRMSQLDLAGEADISTRHLSFVETGRSLPSREMVLRLAERLDVPLRERNALLVAAGYAPMYRERPLDDPALSAARLAQTDERERALLPVDGELNVGDQFQTDQDRFAPVVTVQAIEGDEVLLDANHPLAGEDLVFDIELVEIVGGKPLIIMP